MAETTGKPTQSYRMTLKTYRRIRRCFKGERGETVASYFERLSQRLNKIWWLPLRK